MSVRLKIFASCLGFVLIIAIVGGLAQQQAAQLGRFAIGIYDHAFMGMLYEDGGDGAPRDDAKSLEWMQRACDAGEPRACEWIKSRPQE